MGMNKVEESGEEGALKTVEDEKKKQQHRLQQQQQQKFPRSIGNLFKEKCGVTLPTSSRSSPCPTSVNCREIFSLEPFHKSSILNGRGKRPRGEEPTKDRPETTSEKIRAVNGMSFELCCK